MSGVSGDGRTGPGVQRQAAADLTLGQRSAAWVDSFGKDVYAACSCVGRHWRPGLLPISLSSVAACLWRGLTACFSPNDSGICSCDDARSCNTLRARTSNNSLHLPSAKLAACMPASAGVRRGKIPCVAASLQLGSLHVQHMYAFCVWIVRCQILLHSLLGNARDNHETFHMTSEHSDMHQGGAALLAP